MIFMCLKRLECQITQAAINNDNAEYSAKYAEMVDIIDGLKKDTKDIPGTRLEPMEKVINGYNVPYGVRVTLDKEFVVERLWADDDCTISQI